MTQKQKIEELEKKVAELETRLAVQESLPRYYPYYYVHPNTYPYQPYFSWQTSTTGDFPPNTNSGTSIQLAAPRDNIAKGLEGKLDEDQIKTLMDEILAINKTVHTDFTCKECGKRQRQPALVPDAKAVTSALTELMNQSWGRPGDSKVETEIIVNRNVYLVAEEDEDGDDQLDVSS